MAPRRPFSCPLSIFDIFQTLDREKLAIEFNKHKANILDKKFFIQVNTGMEKSTDRAPIPMPMVGSRKASGRIINFNM